MLIGGAYDLVYVGQVLLRNWSAVGPARNLVACHVACVVVEVQKVALASFGTQW